MRVEKIKYNWSKGEKKSEVRVTMNAEEDPPDGGGSTSSRIDWAQEMEKMDAVRTGNSIGQTSNNLQKREDVVYTHKDAAPYRVYFELRNDEDGTKKINKFGLGSTLRSNDTYKRHIVDMKYAGRQKILVFLNSYVKANQLVKHINESSKIYRAYVPQHLVCITGVLAGIPSEIPIEQIAEDLECEVPIVAVRRLTRFNDGIKIPTNRVSVTFRTSSLPDKVRLFCCMSRVQPFIQKVVVCLNCLRTNHRTTNCRSAKRCQRCAERHEDKLEYANCGNSKKCANCRSTEHTTTDPNCPEIKRQDKIKKLMAKRNLTYAEAKEQVPTENQNLYEALYDAEEFPTLSDSFADMAKGNFRWKDPLREQWLLANNERKKIQAAVYLGKPDKQNKKRKTTTNAEITTEKRNNIVRSDGSESASGAALNNSHRVDEKERWETVSKQVIARVQNEQQNQLMTFYTDFIAQLDNDEETKEMFKTCTRRHFNFAKSVIHQTDTK